MTDNDRKEFGALLLGVGEVFDKAPTDAAIETYWMALKHLPLASIRKGIAKHLIDPDRGRFMPRPADIIAAAMPRRRLPMLAWAEVERSISKHGRYRSVQFDDASINAVIRDMGGWVWLCDQDLDEPWTQKEFERRYEAYARESIGTHESLPGINEIDNRAAGYVEAVRDPILIGSGDRRLLDE